MNVKRAKEQKIRPGIQKIVSTPPMKVRSGLAIAMLERQAEEVSESLFNVNTNTYGLWAGIYEEPVKTGPIRDPEQTKRDFAALTGFKKTLGIYDRARHSTILGDLEDYKKAEDTKGATKRLCGVCGDPFCPWSD